MMDVSSGPHADKGWKETQDHLDVVPSAAAATGVWTGTALVLAAGPVPRQAVLLDLQTKVLRPGQLSAPIKMTESPRSGGLGVSKHS